MLDRWVTSALRCHSEETARFLEAEKDPFRNPVGHTLRENLAVLLDQVLGKLEPERAQAALENIIRVRAVQELTPSQALQFIFQLRPILRQSLTDTNYKEIEARIDQLALWAFDEYARCRERIADLRISESRRGMGLAALRRVRELSEPAHDEPGVKAGHIT